MFLVNAILYGLPNCDLDRLYSVKKLATRSITGILEVCIRIFFADFEKGFDLVDHNVVVDELQKLQVNPAIIRWIKSFLSWREQSVKIGFSTSTWKRANGGLPQGTKLGPFLFSVLVNSLLEDWSARIKFVDDTTALEVVPRCSPSLLPILVDEIAHFA